MSAEARPTGAETDDELVQIVEKTLWLCGWRGDAAGVESIIAKVRNAQRKTRLRSTETPTEGEAVGYVVVQHVKVWSDRDETQPLVVSGSAPKSLEAALRLAAVERERSACEITVHPVGPALSPVEPEEGDG